MSNTSKTFQGKPCQRGHEGLRYLCNGACVHCTAENAARRREKLKRPPASPPTEVPA